MRFLLLLFLIQLTGCGKPEGAIDERLRPLLEEYLDHAPNFGRYMQLGSMSVEEIADNEEGVKVAGKCGRNETRKGNRLIGFHDKAATYEITIDPLKMGTATWKARVFHELGHCLHGFEHSTDHDSIMYATEAFGEEREQYWQENLERQLALLFKSKE